jgi:predicted metal-dependent phosphoesterase TrpH
MAEAGLDGLEVWHPKHEPGHNQRFLDLARELDLVATGGSDYHGRRVGDARVGQEPVPEETVALLRERRSHR